jgi:uncharacterized protein
LFEAYLRAQLPHDAAHDILHIRRVVATAVRLASAEGARLEIVYPAAWLHDCVVVPKDSPQRPLASRLAAETAVAFLSHIGYAPALLPAIEHAIAAHSFSAGIAPRTLEAQIVQDADRLDALGAVGIARCLITGASMGRPFYDSADPFCRQRPADDQTATLDHFYTKLLRLAQTMQTAAGRAEAHRRTAFMRAYLAQLERELDMG